MKTFNKKIKVVVEKTRTGFSAYAEDFAIYTTGKTITSLQKNILEAANLFFADEGLQIKKQNVALIIDLKQFFQYYKVLNAKHLAEKIGMNPTLLSQYVQGRKKPSSKQSERIINGIQQIGQELSELRLLNN